LGTGTSANLSYNWGDATYHFPTDGTGQPVDANQRSDERGPAASLSVAHRLSGALELRAHGVWRETRVWFSDLSDSPDDDGSFESRDLVRRAGAGAAVHWRPRRDVVLTAGADYEDQRQHGRSEFAASYGTFPDSTHVRRWTTGYYGQALLGADGPLNAMLGVRLDRNQQFGTHGTVRGGVTYRLDGWTRVRVAAGTGFKEPTFYENFAQGFVRGNPELDPERSLSWEAGLEHTFPGGRVTLSLTYFDQRFRDLIEYAAAPVPPESVNYFNVAGARSAGLEARVAARLGHGVVATVAYGYLDTRVVEGGPDGGPDGLFVAGLPLIRRAAHRVSPEVAAPLGRRGHVTLAVRWVGPRDDLDFSRDPGERRVTLRSYARVNVAAEYELGRGGPAGTGLVVTARVENLMNDDAREISGFRPRGRTILFGGRLSFGG
jgi:vitamin B12 transporter